MGWCYKHGYGVPKDLAEAKRWYRKLRMPVFKKPKSTWPSWADNDAPPLCSPLSWDASYPATGRIPCSRYPVRNVRAMRSTAPQPAVDAHKTTEGLNRLRPIPSRRFARPDPPDVPKSSSPAAPSKQTRFPTKKRVKISIYTYGNPTGKADLCGVEFSQKRNELPFRKMKNLLAQLKTEDWVIVLAGVTILALALLFPAGMPAMPKTLAGGDAWLRSRLHVRLPVRADLPLHGRAGTSGQGNLRLAAGDFRRRAGGAGRGIRPAVQGFGTGIGLLLGDLRPGGQQLLPGSGMAETGDPKRILYQNRHRLPRRDDPLRRNPPFGRLCARTGIYRRLPRLVLRLLGLAPHEGRRRNGHHAIQFGVDLRRFGGDRHLRRHQGRQQETLLHHLAGARMRRSDDVRHAVAGETRPARTARRSEGRRRGGRRLDGAVRSTRREPSWRRAHCWAKRPSRRP